MAPKAKAPPAKPGAKTGAKGPPNAMIAKLKMQMEKQKEEEERLKREQEEEERRLREEERLAEEQRKFEEEQKRLQREQEKEDAKIAKKEAKKDQSKKLQQMAAAGFILPDIEKLRAEAQKEKEEQKARPKPVPKPAPKVAHVDPEPQVEAEPEPVLPEDWEDMAEWEQEEWMDSWKAERAAAKAAAQKQRDDEEAERRAAAAKEEAKVLDLRSPICCVLGHVDTGKTSLLDRIRATNVQGGEAGGITQQIGATFFPRESLVAATEELNKKYKHRIDVPGLLVIDTPGHESFTNLRSRGSSLCDIAILVVDIMHGLEPQTKECIRLLKERRCPFIIALNKIDRLYDWEPHENMDSEQTLELQKPYVKEEFATRTTQVLTELAEQGLNAELYYKNKDVKRYVSVVPTSAKTGEGICDLILLKIQLVQQFMEGKVTFKNDLQCTVLEMKPIQGVGFTIDVVLINGTLHEGDLICVCGSNGPICTQIRALLTPQPMKELRVRGEYVHHKEIKAAMGIKIAGNDLEFAVPGTQLLVYHNEEEKAKCCKDVMTETNSLLSLKDKSGVGVTVQSSTLGSLEALLSFLRDMKIPVASVAIGPMYKRHMVSAQRMKSKEPKYAVVLAFDVVITDEADQFAKDVGITVFRANIIYHLFDYFTKYCATYDQRIRDEARSKAIFPVHLQIVAAIHNTDPMILAVKVHQGQLHPGTPLCVIDKGKTIYVGKVESIEKDNKELKKAMLGADVACKINTSESGASFGRQVSADSQLISQISRESVDAIKLFKSEMQQDDTALLSRLMDLLHIPKNKPAPKSAANSSESVGEAEE